MIRAFIELNKKLSHYCDKILPQRLKHYANEYFDDVLMDRFISEGVTVMDIGGGKNPNISKDIKAKKGLYVIGMDIDEEELKKAPEGAYDEVLKTDICQGVEIDKKADLIIARALMEHVPDSRAAIENMARLLKPGGRMIFFLPCKYAWFTLINRMLPEGFKVKLLNLCFPEKMHRLGFKAYYDSSSPSAFEKIAKESDLSVEELKVFYNSDYFRIFVPFYLAWRFYQILILIFGLRNFCEAFTIVLQKT